MPTCQPSPQVRRNMDQPIEMLYQGHTEWNAWREAHRDPELRPDLRGLKLSKFSDDPDLADYDLSRVRLSGAP
jgi:hypothetical protein